MHTDHLSSAARGSLAAAMIVRDDQHETAHTAPALGIPMHTVIACPDCGGEPALVAVVVDEALLPNIPIRVLDVPTVCPEMRHPFSPAQVNAMHDRLNAHIARVGQHMLLTHVRTPRERERSEFWSAHRTAQAMLDAATRERDERGAREIAALIPEGMQFDNKDMLYRYCSLVTRHRNGGAPLKDSERHQLWRSASLFWMQGSAVAV